MHKQCLELSCMNCSTVGNACCRSAHGANGSLHFCRLQGNASTNTLIDGCKHPQTCIVRPGSRTRSPPKSNKQEMLQNHYQATCQTNFLQTPQCEQLHEQSL
jgi:hypothetical protein